MKNRVINIKDSWKDFCWTWEVLKVSNKSHNPQSEQIGVSEFLLFLYRFWLRPQRAKALSFSHPLCSNTARSYASFRGLETACHNQRGKETQRTRDKRQEKKKELTWKGRRHSERNKPEVIRLRYKPLMTQPSRASIMHTTQCEDKACEMRHVK